MEAVQAVGKIVQGIGAYRAGQQNKKALEAGAWEEIRTGNAEELRIRDTARAQMGEQIAAQFGNGMLGGTGSALDALQMSQVNAALDALTVRRERQARAENMRAQGRMAAEQGKFALVSSVLQAGGDAYGMNKDWAAARSGSSVGRGT